MRSTFETPLPGDVVVMPITAARGQVHYALALWPDLERERHDSEYLSYGYALDRARLIASRHAVEIWRMWSRGTGKHDFENVTGG